MKLAHGATVDGCKRHILTALIEQIEPVFLDRALELEIVRGFVREPREIGHSRGDAIDLSLEGETDIKGLKDSVYRALGPTYKVEFEVNCLHIEKLLIENGNIL